MKRIMLVGENPMFLRETQDAFSKDFEVKVASNAEEALDRFLQSPDQIVLIDCHSDRIEILDLVDQIRAHHSSTRFLVTSSTPTKEVLMRALNLKVDGFHERPSSWESLKQKIELAATPPAHDDIQVDSYRRAVVLGSDSIPLTKTEFSLLMLFRQKPGVFLTRDEISGEIWPDSTVAKNNLDTHLSRLRTKIPPLKTRLLCLRGEGFVYTPPGTGPGFSGRSTKRR